jgi:RNA polymerase sigma-70 factor (ECF subfamily)
LPEPASLWNRILTERANGRGTLAAVEGRIPDPSGLGRRLRAGDPGSLDELVRIFSTPVRDLCRRRIADRDLADDLAQETFIRAMGSIGSFDETREIWPWLSTIARNICIDTARTWSRRPPPLRLEVEASQEDGFTRQPAELVDLDDPASHAADADRTRRLRNAIAAGLEGLSPLERKAVWFHHAEEEEYETIAARERATVHAVRNAAFRARRHLRSALAAAARDLRTVVLVGGGLASALRRQLARARDRAGLAVGRLVPFGPEGSLGAGLAVVIGAIALAAAVGPALPNGSGPGLDRGIAFRSPPPEATHAGDRLAPSGGRQAIGYGVGALAPAGYSAAVDRRGDAVGPRETTLRVSVHGLDGRPLFWWRSTVECGDERDWERLPNDGPVRANC